MPAKSRTTKSQPADMGDAAPEPPVEEIVLEKDPDYVPDARPEKRYSSANRKAPQPKARKPLTDDFAALILILQRNTEKLSRLRRDDRFTRNRKMLAAKYDSDLARMEDIIHNVRHEFRVASENGDTPWE